KPAPTPRRSTSTAVPSPSATRSARPGDPWPPPCSTSWSKATDATDSRSCAKPPAWQTQQSSNASDPTCGGPAGTGVNNQLVDGEHCDHGYAGVREQGIEPFARAFAHDALVVLL